MPRHAHRNWALSILSKEKDIISGPKEWGRLALHHKISKTNLDLIATDLEKAMRGKDEDLAAAAKKFWSAVTKLAGGKILAAANGNTQKVLWNLPVNLEIGPAEVAENPGTRFDPNTEPIPNDPEGRRRLTSESAPLQRLEEVYLTANRSRRAPKPKEWAEMTRLLLAAGEEHVTAGKNLLLAAPHPEQWLKQVGDDTRDNQKDEKVTWQRKRLRRFPGVKQGIETFSKARALKEDLSATVKGLMPKKLVEAYSFDDGDEKYTLVLELDAPDLDHMCRRHTYQHFDFGQAKLVNTFWPVDQVSGASRTYARVTAALPKIAQAAFEAMDLAEILGGWTGGKLTCVNVPTDDATIFFIATAEVADDDDDSMDDKKYDDDDVNYNDNMDGNEQDAPTKWVVRLKTVAPDGDSAQAFTEAELKEIHKGLQLL